MPETWTLGDEARYTILRLTGEGSEVNQRDHLIMRCGYAGVPKHQAEKEMEWLRTTGCVTGDDVIWRTEKGTKYLLHLQEKSRRIDEARPDPKKEMQAILDADDPEPSELRQRVKTLYAEVGQPNGEGFDQLADSVADQIRRLQSRGWENDPIARFYRGEGVWTETRSPNLEPVDRTSESQTEGDQR